MKKRFLRTINGVTMFYEVEARDTYMRITKGRLTCDGMERGFNFKTADDCRKAAEEACAERLAEGFVAVMNQPDASDEEAIYIGRIREHVGNGNQKRAIENIREIDSKELHAHIRDYALAVGIDHARKTRDTELFEFCMARLGNHTDCVELAFTLSCKAATEGDRETMLQHAVRAVELGKTTGNFVDEAAFAMFLFDDDFKSVIGVEELLESFYGELFPGDNIGISWVAGDTSLPRTDPRARKNRRMQATSFCQGETVDEQLFDELLQFQVQTNGIAPRHYIAGDKIVVVSDALLKALRELNIPNLQAFPAVLRENDREWTGYNALNIIGCCDVLDDEASEYTSEFMSRRSYREVVYHDLKLKQEPKLFRPRYLESRVVMAGSVFDRLVEMAPTEKWGISLEDVEISRHSALPTIDSLTDEEWYQAALDSFEKRQLGTAQAYTMRLIEKNPSLPKLWNLVGAINERHGKKVIYTHAIEGREYYKKAVECYSYAVSLDETYVAAWCHLGRVLTEYLPRETGSGNEQFDKERGVECYRRALALEKTEKNYRRLLEFVYQDERLKLLQDWVSNDAQNPHAWGELGDYYREAEDYPKAIEHLEKSLSVQQTGMSYYSLFYATLAVKDLKKARWCIDGIEPSLVGYGYRQIPDDYVTDMRQRLRKREREIEKESGKRASTKGTPKDQVTTTAYQELEARRQALWRLLESYEPAAHAFFCVKPDEVKAAIESLDDGAIVSTFREVLQTAFDDITEGGKPYQGLRYEWYYGGDPDCYGADGIAYAECSPDGFSKTDLVKIPNGPYLERQEPEMSGESTNAGHIDIDLVMAPWYGNLARRYDDADYTGITNTPLHEPFNAAEKIYDELFRIKLYMLLNRAYCELNPIHQPYLYLSLHERWPILVAGPDSNAK